MLLIIICVLLGMAVGDAICYAFAAWPSGVGDSLSKAKNWIPGAGFLAIYRYGFRILILVLCLSSVSWADSLTISQVTQDLRHESPLTLRNDVSDDLAANLLAAQAAASYTSFEPDSLQLSIDAVLKAIALEQSLGATYCDDSTCPIVWAQGNIAIDDRVGITLNPPALNFAADPIATATPEPSMIFVLAGAVCIALIFWPRKYRR